VTKWQYRQVVLAEAVLDAPQRAAVGEELGRLGDEGWELLTVVRFGATGAGLVYVLRKPSPLTREQLRRALERERQKVGGRAQP
jgi:hypothetical protein